MPELIDFGSLQVRFLQSRHDTGDALDMFELILSPNGRMPVPHYHESWEETVYGLEGVVTYTVEGVPHDLPGGTTLHIPRGKVHGFYNHTGVPAKCLCVLTPGVLGPEYFRELAAVIRGGNPDAAVMTEIMSRYRLIPG
jgi:quercetin dioxygenase-like cupin family protein